MPGRNAGLLALLVLAAPLRLAAEAPRIPFEIFRLNDTGGTVEVKYQLLLPPENPPRAAHAKIRARLLAEFFPDEAHVRADLPAALLARTQSGLLREYDETYTGLPEPTAHRWQDERVQRVVLERGDLLVMEHQTYSQTGGAHGNERKVFLLFDSRSGEELVLADLFQAGTDGELTERIKARLREKANAPANEDVNKLGYWEKDIHPQNPFVTKTGVGFHYNTYEIAPYVMGSVDVEFTFAELHGLLKPGGPLGPLPDSPATP